MSELRKSENFEEGSQKAELCINCREFFGSIEKLCSKCYRDKSKESAKKLPQTQTIINKVSKQESEISISKDQKPALEESKTKEETEKAEKTEKKEAQESNKQDHSRCLQCNKRVGILGFKCQCESTFCRNHRLPEAHNCNFDFLKDAKERLVKENLAVKVDKVQRF